MKQLLPYYLFFVGSAVILIQCAKMFPTENKSPTHQAEYPAKIDGSMYNEQHDEALNITSSAPFKTGDKTKAITQFFSSQSLTNNPMVNVNYHLLLVNAYNNLNHHDLIRKYYLISQNDK